MSRGRMPKMEPIEPDADLYTWERFVKNCQDGNFIDYDGFGELATATQVSNRTISPSRVMKGFVPPAWATHVVWYNR